MSKEKLRQSLVASSLFVVTMTWMTENLNRHEVQAGNRLFKMGCVFHALSKQLCGSFRDRFSADNCPVVALHA